MSHHSVLEDIVHAVAFGYPYDPFAPFNPYDPDPIQDWEYACFSCRVPVTQRREPHHG